MADFWTVMLRFDPEDGSAEIEGRVRVAGMRVVHETKNGAGEHVYVVRSPGHSYRSLAGAGHSPAMFEVFVEDYTEHDLRHGVHEDDRPWIRVRPFVHFPVLAGTKRSY